MIYTSTVKEIINVSMPKKFLLFVSILILLGCEYKPATSPKIVAPQARMTEAQLANLASEHALGYSTRYVYLIPSQPSDLTGSKQKALLADATADFQRGAVDDAVFIMGSIDPAVTQRFFMSVIEEAGPTRLKGAPVVLLGVVEKSGELEKEATRIQGTLRLPAIGEARD